MLRHMVSVCPAPPGAQCQAMVTTQGNDPLIDNAAKGRDWFHAETADEWRSRLAANHATSTGCWLVTWKKPTGQPAPSYDEKPNR
jgi:hypothetical protein